MADTVQMTLVHEKWFLCCSFKIKNLVMSMAVSSPSSDEMITLTILFHLV